MSGTCWICLNACEGAPRYHTQCLQRLFGTKTAPVLDLEMSKLHTAALAMIGRVSISGVQRKLSVSLSSDRMRLQIAMDGGRYILKPRADTFPFLPENELLTMRIAESAGVEIPPCGIVELRDGSKAYIVWRFDRPDDGGKLRQEDFCQLAELPPKDKYRGSAEFLVRLVQRYASEPLVEIRKLYRLLIVVWVTGNGDMHLKNFSLLTGRDGLHRLSPTYDLLCSRLVIPDDHLALSINGKNNRLRAGDWKRLADYCGLPERAADRVRSEVSGALDGVNDLIGRSLLPEEMKAEYEELIEKRVGSLR